MLLKIAKETWKIDNLSIILNYTSQPKLDQLLIYKGGL